MSDATIRAALDAAIFAVTGFPDASHRALEDDSYDPAIGEPWARISHLWGPETLGTLPASGGTLWRLGLVKIGLFFPLLGGSSGGDTLAQAIKDAFPAGRSIAVGGRALQIVSSRRWDGGRDADGPWYLVPVDLSWRMRATNPLT